MSGALGRSFARLVTNAVVRRPLLWRVFRAPLRKQFDRLAPRWDAMRGPEHLDPLEAALAALRLSPARVLDLGTGTGDAAAAAARFVFRFGSGHYGCSPSVVTGSRKVNTLPSRG